MTGNAQCCLVIGKRFLSFYQFDKEKDLILLIKMDKRSPNCLKPGWTEGYTCTMIVITRSRLGFSRLGERTKLLTKQSQSVRQTTNETITKITQNP